MSPLPGGLTLSDVDNRRTLPSGLVAESYLPRYERFAGTSRQLREAGVLPQSFPGFPADESENGWTCARWKAGGLSYSVQKHYVSRETQQRSDATADCWMFDWFDDRYTFSDYLERR